MKVSESLLPKLDEILRRENVLLKELDYIGVVLGPGSFTGIRVGISTIKAFVSALKIKLIAKNTFEIVKDYVKDGQFISKCTNTSCYFAKIRNCCILETGVKSNDEVLSMLEDSRLMQLDSEIGVEEDHIELLSNYENILLNTFDKSADNEEYVKAEELEPYYVQLSQAEISLKAKGMGL